MKPFLAVVARDLRLAVRQGGATLLAVVFFLLTVTLFPLGIGPEPGVLARIAPGVLWVAALLAAMLSLDRLFQADFEDGSLEQLALSGLPFGMIALAKIIAHWLTTGLPLLLAAPLLAVLLNMDAEGFGALLVTMLIGTPALSLIGAIGAALTLTVRRGGVLLSLLVLPLYVPVLIFGVSAIDAAVHGLNAKPHLLLLGALTMAALPLCPWAASAALKLSLE
ncbi:MAG: heme exporter protein CcmB [Alphaproteobacteria bacterium]|jgi:heme exporter protein B|nr:heme exporter protein CcmB [Alphaproteobacteria bacterium]MDP6566946.1 heme exporter protein CcmB [Alphaproteobacteria bacterium]MDP6813746.1 heme exporter protein CcmB [Alphaproteobacteria bacterium]